MGGGGRGAVGWGRGQGGCERRIEGFVKIQKKILGGGVGGGGSGGQWGGVGVVLGGQSGCERRNEVFVKIQKKKKNGWGGSGGGGGGGSVAEGVRWGMGLVGRGSGWM